MLDEFLNYHYYLNMLEDSFMVFKAHAYRRRCCCYKERSPRCDFLVADIAVYQIFFFWGEGPQLSPNYKTIIFIYLFFGQINLYISKHTNTQQTEIYYKYFNSFRTDVYFN